MNSTPAHVLDEGSVFELEGELYLVEQLTVQVTVIAQRIESHRDLHDKFMESGEPQQTPAPTFLRLEGERSNPMWNNLRLLTPQEPTVIEG